MDGIVGRERPLRSGDNGRTRTSESGYCSIGGRTGERPAAGQEDERLVIGSIVQIVDLE